jgi:hypothetical protein
MYEVDDPARRTPKWRSMLNLVLRELGAFVLLVMVFLLLLSIYRVRDYLSCRYVDSVVVQIFVLEFYRLVFPGTLHRLPASRHLRRPTLTRCMWRVWFDRCLQAFWQAGWCT